MDDKTGKSVLVAQTGANLSTVGEMKLSKGSFPQSKLMNNPGEQDADVAELESALIADINGIPANVPLALTEEQVPRAAGSILPPGAERIEIVDGTAYLGVSVKTNGEVTADQKSWGKVKFDKGVKVDVSEDGTELIVPVPANAEQGFIVLESGEAGK